MEKAPRRPSQTQLVLLGVAVLAVILIPLWCTRGAAPLVRAAKAHRGPLRAVVTTNGKVEPVDDAELEVRARLDGRIVEIPDPGARIEAGQVVFRIDEGAAAAELAKAKSERLAALESLRAARHELSVAQERFATDRDLHEQGALTRERYGESKAALQDAEERVASLEKEVPLRVASLDLQIEELAAQKQSAVFTAPFTGTVYKTEAKEGEHVRVGDPILWIADLDRLRVRTNVDQVDLGRVLKGQRVNIASNAYPGRAWIGYVTEVVPHVVIKESRSVSEALARLDPPTDGLVPGMMVDAEIIVGEASNALQVPTEAIHENADEAFVYRVDGKRIRKTPVKRGLSSLTDVEIIGGLDAGDLVVVGPAEGLADGMRVDVDTK